MKHTSTVGKSNRLVLCLLILGLSTIIFPLYLTVVIAFKQPSEMTNSISGILSLPRTWSLANFREAMEVTDFWHSLKNSLVMPLAKQTAELGLANWAGVIILYVVFYMPMNIMLYSGYLVNIPMALEEAAKVDGASTWTTYWKVIFPIMSPMHATVAVITALAVWNDVMTPLIIMAGSGENTLPLAQLNFQSQFGTNYNLAFASYLLSLIPILIFYIICQRQILNGVTNGAVK